MWNLGCLQVQMGSSIQRHVRLTARECIQSPKEKNHAQQNVIGLTRKNAPARTSTSGKYVAANLFEPLDNLTYIMSLFEVPSSKKLCWLA
jgi:hypothetical protein